MFDIGWFDVDMEKLTSVYVSGMPVDITDEEFKELMNKCGLVMYDVRTRKPKLKLYKDKNGGNKGDGLCCYIKVCMSIITCCSLVSLSVRGEVGLDSDP